MYRLLPVFLLFLALPARANLGETIAQCVQRYGKPVGFTEANSGSPFGTLIFIAGPYQLIVFLSNGAEVGARVTKKDKSAFSADEMKTIMNADASTPWISTASSDPGIQQWSRADKAAALYDKDKKMLLFTSPQMTEAMRHPPPIPSPAPATNATPTGPVVPKTAGPFAPAPPAPWAPVAGPTTNSTPSAATPP
jgi:hypothetical protein